MYTRNKNRTRFRSTLEQRVSDNLDKLGVKYEYETEKIPYRKKIRQGRCIDCDSKKVYQLKHYVPDFILPNGIRLEVKGRLTSEDRAKLQCVKEQHPDLDLRIVFGANNKIDKTKEYRYLDWAADRGIPASLKVVPPEWVK